MSDPMDTIRDIVYPGYRAPVTPISDAAELKRQRAVKAAQKRKERARLTTEQRAGKRREADARYRDAHREQRREYDREYLRRRKELGL